MPSRGECRAGVVVGEVVVHRAKGRGRKGAELSILSSDSLGSSSRGGRSSSDSSEPTNEGGESSSWTRGRP
uniref:Uncharacterized protein n=1 Tax=Chromera velia CCMP2878 TaxID=1169474 RepID=A0A0G4HPB7_9ALVE|eukprot:Cvel_7817.t1-p1 / transcript=Cvel_7817.t1 / gene=Cvel_7817 / organism=Chromera_velia_CCMP2878 / gene_product=hypothetical protein / transcript_product=hypothetical protein / location=Cvel_scaffold417:48325-48534(+) / protein_length=70 / sequence_SO=supercontig / SO=protein_coding / is_pseudo=false